MNEKEKIIKLTCAEISSLWATYMNDCMVICVMTHFSETVEDSEVKQIVEETIQIAQKHKSTIKDIFINEGIAVPNGFEIDKDVVHNAPKLFSDIFYLNYVLQMSKFGVTSHTAGLTLAARKDIRQMYDDFIDDTSQLFQDVVDCLEGKGVFVRMPYMNYQKEVTYVDEKKFLTGWFGRRRALLGVEVTHLTMNAINNEIGRATCTGFSQVAKDKELRDYFLRGKHVCAHLLSSIQDVLEESDVPTAMSWDQSVTASTEAPFSDQLMLYIVGELSNLGIAAYGNGIATSMRRDIASMYLGFMSKTGAYGEDGLNLMIERNWMELPPQFDDRDKLAKSRG
ncbi:DUF3231 family protein [Ferdinandcohnia quinoae]|uniref:DUF3231 family protein n=1 Tax=Fredinandcohnia quinoae TaxID=2918902 RepID=A0AAW5DUA5_9BACI|nr:DUF3231 family protein [Fredinandcohnia sp. SECRCQ15]MCH1624212.1 DUF3231 family protein [Fredinandcohnia sp. SECRCQ15]